MMDPLKQSVEGRAPPCCPDCQTEMTQYRPMLASDMPPAIVAHRFFQCPNCSRVQETMSKVDQNDLLLPLPSRDARGADLNEPKDKAQKYRHFAEECMQLIACVPQDSRRQLEKMAEAWLDLAYSELNSESAAGTTKVFSSDPHNEV
jgi:hypothetical protein